MIRPEIRETLYLHGDDHRHDPWGAVMLNWFGISTALNVSGNGSAIPDAWEFNAGAITREAVETGDEFDCDRDYLALIESGAVSIDELTHTGDVLQRASAILKTMDRDY